MGASWVFHAYPEPDFDRARALFDREGEGDMYGDEAVPAWPGQAVAGCEVTVYEQDCPMPEPVAARRALTTPSYTGDRTLGAIPICADEAWTCEMRRVSAVFDGNRVRVPGGAVLLQDHVNAGSPPELTYELLSEDLEAVRLIAPARVWQQPTTPAVRTGWAFFGWVR